MDFSIRRHRQRPDPWLAAVAVAMAVSAAGIALMPQGPVVAPSQRAVRVTFAPEAVFVDGERVDGDTVRARLLRLHEATPERPLVVRAQDGVRFGRLRQVLRAGHEMGFVGVAVETR